VHAFLDVFEPIHEAYVKELAHAQEIDFDDMILRAANYVENGKYKSPYSAIIVDEFQDISVGRARLIKALLNQNHLIGSSQLATTGNLSIVLQDRTSR
jgi:DNA helicase IV